MKTKTSLFAFFGLLIACMVLLASFSAKAEVSIQDSTYDQSMRDMFEAIAKNQNHLMCNATLTCNGTHVSWGTELAYAIQGIVHRLSAGSASLAGINDYDAQKNATVANYTLFVDADGTVNATKGDDTFVGSLGSAATAEYPDTGYDVAVLGVLKVYSASSVQLDLDDSAVTPLTMSTNAWFTQTNTNPKYALTE